MFDLPSERLLERCRPNVKYGTVYTPSEIVDCLIAYADNPPKLVADFACGEGALLDGATRRWPKLSLIGVDRDRSAIQRLADRLPLASSTCINFLSEKSRKKSLVLRSAIGRVDLVLLNPPFSDRFESRPVWQIGGKKVLVPRSVAFILASMPYLHPNGEILAILPSSIVNADECYAWARALRSSIVVLRELPASASAFPGLRINTVLARIKHFDVDMLQVSTKQKVAAIDTIPGVEVVRGRVWASLGTSKKRGAAVQFVHSTSLKSGVLNADLYIKSGLGQIISGPAVLLPRVGKPDSGKIVLLPPHLSVVLSDCVLGIKTDQKQVEEIACWLRGRPRMQELYTGTCAKYTTINRLWKLLCTVGWRSNST